MKIEKWKKMEIYVYNDRIVYGLFVDYTRYIDYNIVLERIMRYARIKRGRITDDKNCHM